MHRLFANAVVHQAEVGFKSVKFTVFSVGAAEINVMVFYLLVSVVSMQDHAQITLLFALVLQDALLFLTCFLHSYIQLSTMHLSSVFALGNFT